MVIHNLLSAYLSVHVFVCLHLQQHHAEAIEMEQRRANEAEERLRLQAQHEERRVATLENRLSELSDTVGNYDRQREGDQMAIL